MENLKISNELSVDYKLAFNNPKLWINNYYDNIINEIDIRSEQILVKNRQFSNEINPNREKLLACVKHAKTEALEAFEKNAKLLEAKIKAFDSEKKFERLKKELLFNKSLFFVRKSINNEPSFIGILVTNECYINSIEILYVK